MSGRPLGARAALTAALLALPLSLVAQAPPVTGYTGVEARGLSYGTGFGIKSVTEITVPFAVIWQTSPRLTFDLGGRYATVSRTDETGASASISGLTDVQVRGSYQLVPDIAVFSVAVNLPTGTSKLTPEQLPVASVIASDMIPFPVANFASGFNVTSGVALAVPFYGWAVGVAGSYRLNQGFSPFADTSASYKAGGEFRMRIGADRIVGQSRLSLGFTYSTFGEDQYASSPIFQAGKRYISQASWSFPIGNLGLVLYAWDLYRSAGSISINGTPTQKRNVLTLGGAGAINIGRNVLRPQLEFRSHTLGVSQLGTAGLLLSVGARYELHLGDRFMLLPAARFDTGNENALDANGNPTTTTVGFTGWNVGLTLRASM